MENTAELVFLPGSGVGHLAPMVELAQALTNCDHRISITVFIMNLPFQSKINSYTESLLSNEPPPRVRFVLLTLDEAASDHIRSKPRGQVMPELVKIHKPSVKKFISESTRPVVAFVVDMFCIPFTDVAAEFEVPAYAFFTCGFGTLSLLLHLQSLHDDENRNIVEFKDSDIKLRVSGFVNLVPAKVLPWATFEKDNTGSLNFLPIPRRLRTMKGILVNTFTELEPHGMECLSKDTGIPPLFPVGPVLKLKPDTNTNVDEYKDIMTWLDTQPVASVIFLCFGSMGSFEAEQVVEIAMALEQSGHRFLWSLRRPPPKGKMEPPSEYNDFREVLPEGFIDRTKEIGKVIGWAPQVAVLSHQSVGGFVSHCGWNSILESLWCGVPVATWPLYAEQQLNAFQLVKDLGLSVEIKIDYRKEKPDIVTADEIQRGIKQLMEGTDSAKIRKKVKTMREKSRIAVVEDGSSYVAMGHFIDEVLSNSS